MKLKIPYRINWAGAYLDCINEPVITSVINKYLTFKCKKRKDNIVIVDSKEFPEMCITDFKYHPFDSNHWCQYVNGCIAVLLKNNFKLEKGCEITVYNDLPSGIGAASSASFIIGIIKSILWANKIKISDDLIANYAYLVEHDYLHIPCGKMDFKAVLHSRGIWKVDTSNFSLDSDKLLDKSSYVGLLIYNNNEKHENLTDKTFSSFAQDIKLKYQYIEFEKVIVNALVEQSKQKYLNAAWLGMFMNNTYLNMTVNLFREKCTFNETEGVYGDKLLGSGIKGAHFLLVDKNKIKDLINKYNKNYTVIKCII